MKQTMPPSMSVDESHLFAQFFPNLFSLSQTSSFLLNQVQK